MDAAALLSLVKKDCKKNGVQLHLGQGANVLSGGMPCSGYFDDGTPRLAVAIGKPEMDYFPILIHEYSHMQQWLEQCSEWVNLGRSCELIDGWIAGDEFSKEEVNNAINRIIDVELDCERRTVAFIEANNIDINVTEYIQKSNAYVLFYNTIRETRKWYNPDRKPYLVEEVWGSMPTVFGVDNYKLTPEQLNAFALL